MSNEKVKQGKKFVVGLKQTAKALKRDEVKELLIAADADPKLVDSLLDLAKEKGVPIKKATSMKELGSAFGINVGASAVALLH